MEHGGNNPSLQDLVYSIQQLSTRKLRTEFKKQQQKCLCVHSKEKPAAGQLKFTGWMRWAGESLLLRQQQMKI